MQEKLPMKEMERHLKQIKVLEDKLARIHENAMEQIDKIKKKEEDGSSEVRRLLLLQKDKLKEIIEKNKSSLFKGKLKSIELEVGTVGYRDFPPRIETTIVTLQKIKELYPSNNGFIRIKEEVDVNAISSLKDEDLLRIGASRIYNNDSFYYRFKK